MPRWNGLTEPSVSLATHLFGTSLILEDAENIPEWIYHDREEAQEMYVRKFEDLMAEIE